MAKGEGAKTVAQAVSYRAVMLTGDESALRRRALDDLLARVGVAPDDFDVESTDGDAGSSADWIASAGTAPFLADRRVVIVRHLLRADPDRVDAKALAALPEAALLILVADDERDMEDSRGRASRWRDKWKKIVAANGGAVVEFDANPRTALAGLKPEVAKSGKQMSDRAMEVLLEMSGGSLSRGLDELEKLVLFVGDAPQIKEGDVRKIVVPSREWNVYRMVDAVVENDVPEALRQLRTLVTNQSKAEDAAFARILPTMSRQLRLIWQARLCIEAGCSASSPSPEVMAQLPEKDPITKLPPYRVGSVMAAARSANLPRLARCLTLLSDADSRLKGILDGFSSMETLERLILEMAATLNPEKRTA
ncbi:DNA polymerase III subunit delta [bacterium]|nr:MAG: DNA polymerase III subunit delta [bacterium]